MRSQKLLILSSGDPMIQASQMTTFSTPGAATYTIPSWAKSLDVWIIGPGGGGGSGAERATNSIRTGGSGGAGGSAARQIFPVSAFGGAGATIPVYVGSGGAGGAAIGSGSSSTNGNNGQSGHGTGIGAIWDYIGTASTVTFNGLAQHSGTWVACGGSGNIWTTTTPTVASSWTQRTSNAGANQLNVVLWAGGSVNKFVAVGQGGTIITSPDGITWTAQTSGVAVSIKDIMFDGTTFIAVGNAGTILTSTDAVTWALNAFTSAANLPQVSSNGTSKYVAIDDQGHIITASTPTGVWTAALVAPSTSYGFFGLAFNGSNLWVASASSGLIYTSPDAVTWTSHGVKWYSTVNNVQMQYVNGYFFLGSFISTDGLTWTNMLAVNLSSGPKGVEYESSTGNYYFSWCGVTRPTGVIGVMATISGNIPTYAFGIVSNANGGAAGTTSNATGGSASTNFGQFAGSSGGGSSSTAAASAGGSTGASGGGGGGGSADASSVNRAPAAGGQASTMSGVTLSAGPAGVAGGLGPAPSQSAVGSTVFWGAPGGSGGAYNSATDGQAGADGGSPGGGGGGGGAADNGNATGAGGAGGNGEVRIIARAA